MATGNSGTLFAASGPMSEDRRKRAFRRLVSDIADSLDDINTRNLHWQVQAPSSLKDKSALDILEHLYKRGSFTEYEVRPLQQLLKDIHREDLTSRVDGFLEEFGRHYSVPEKGMNVKQCGEERRANTFSGSTDNLTNSTTTAQLSANREARAPASPTIVAHQETRPEDNDLEENTLQCHPVVLSRPRQSKSISNSTHDQSLSGDPLSSHPSPSSHPQLLLSYHSNINPSAKSLNNAPAMSEARSHNGACFQSEPCRKMSDVSVFFTQDSSSANSSLLEMRSHSPSKWQMYHIPSDLSSGNVSNENILNCSSREDFLQLSVTGVVATMPYQNGRQWYQTSVSSLPTDKHLSGARPMGRSMSHEYHRTPSRGRAAIGCRRSNTFTQADRHPSSSGHYCQCCGSYRVRSDSTNTCNGHTPHHRLPSPSPRYYHHSPYLSTRRGGGQCCQHGAGCSNQGNFSESAELAELNQQSCYLPTSSNSSVEHGVMPRGAVGDVGWTSGESNCVKAEEGHFATKMSNCKRENMMNNNNYPAAVVAASHSGGEQFVQNDLRSQLNLNENKPHHMINTAAKKCISEQATAEQPRVYETQTLDRRTSIHKQQVSRSQQVSRNSVQSLEGFPNTSGSKFRARSCSAGNTSAVANSSRSASSVNTLTSSRSALSPVGSPPLHRNHGKSDHHTPSQETSGTPALSSSYQAAMMMSSFQEASPVPRWKLFLPGHKTTLKPHLVRPDELVWPVKRSKLNKYIYKRKLKLLTCKTSLEVMGDGVKGQSPKISIQLHPYGAEEDRNISVTMKVALELPRKLQLHSESEIEFKVSAKELQNGSWSCGDSALELAPSKVVREKVTRNFFYIKKFIKHEALKNSSCEYVQVCVSVALVRQKQHHSD